MIDLALAIEHLVPGAKYYGPTFRNTRDEYHRLKWQDERAKPSWEELEAAWGEIKPDIDAEKTAINRATEYPSIEVLTVALWEHIVEGRDDNLEDIQKLREEIKAKYPKPNESNDDMKGKET